MRSVEEKRALWCYRKQRLLQLKATATNMSNSAGGLRRNCKPPSMGLSGKIAMKSLQFAHF